MSAVSDALLSVLGLCLGINWIGFILAYVRKTEVFYDITGSLTCITALTASAFHASTVHLQPTVRGVVSLTLCLLWTLRLGAFLLFRVLRTGHDSRFDKIKHSATSFAFAWTMQGLWIWAVLLPVLLLQSAGHNGRGLGVLEAAGFTLWLAGFMLETVADIQKLAFKLNPANRGRFIDEGVWRYARYPNYCGEITLWSGLFLMCAPGLHSAAQVVAAALSPLFTAVLLLGLSGVPIQEKQAKARWGADVAYQQYRQRTNLLLPWPRSTAKHRHRSND